MKLVHHCRHYQDCICLYTSTRRHVYTSCQSPTDHWSPLSVSLDYKEKYKAYTTINRCPLKIYICSESNFLHSFYLYIHVSSWTLKQLKIHVDLLFQFRYLKYRKLLNQPNLSISSRIIKSFWNNILWCTLSKDIKYSTFHCRARQQTPERSSRNCFRCPRELHLTTHSQGGRCSPAHTARAWS